MSMDAGDCVEGTGLAGLIAKYMKEEIGKDFTPEDAASTINPIAKAIVEHLTDNAEIATTVAAGISVEVTMPPDGTGETDAEGTGAGTIS